MQDNTELKTTRTVGRSGALIQALVVLASVPFAIFFITFVAQSLGINSPALPPLGILISVLIANVFLWRSGGRWADLGLKKPQSIMRSIGIGVLGMIVGFVLFAAMIAITTSFGLPRPDVSVLSNLLSGNSLNYIQFMVLVVWGSAAIGEEMFARGFLLNRMERVFAGVTGGWWLAAALQAGAFGALHFYQGLTGIIGTAIVGFLMAILFRYSGRNLFAPIVAHGLIDTWSITALYLGFGPT
ncbi:CPBP family intramembrane glutamic endopeptidase [Kordiimonas aquimaris]|uniref:CPBP family intramembrane glutamic endopeptidase n=1 Tax=Kordiimonas aquimaris TaxID=707591 RepID=UPI0021CEEDE7|nr:type II CAAX endopeptidase family protein [Kordiimonas aquimaris]